MSDQNGFRMVPRAFINMVRKCRAAQKDYYDAPAYQKGDKLRKAKYYELELDKWLEKLAIDDERLEKATRQEALI